MSDTLLSHSPVEAAERMIAADHAHADEAIWISRLTDDAILSRARKLAAEGAKGRPLWGVPFVVKDNIDVVGVPTTAACPGFAYEPTKTAFVVQRLLDAGALLVGKTNLDQFATGLVGVRSPYGVPRNVFDAARVPGGSSSGSGCTVAAGIVPFALGTDTAGSGRVPAMFGNVVGLKPTIGSLSARGMVPACRSIDTISIFSRTVDEALAVARIASEYDDADPYSRAAPFAHLRRGTLGSVRMGMVERLPPCDDAVAAAYRRAGERFDTVGIEIAPFLDIARLLYEGPWVAERTAALRGMVERRADELHSVTRQILQAGFERHTVDAFDAFHRLAHARRFAARLFARVDALMVPTAPFCPTLAELDDDPIGPNSRLGTFTNFVNLCDLAAVAVPAGFAPNGSPVGVTLIGPAWSEGRLAAMADAIHRACVDQVGATSSPLPLAAPPDAVQAGETALFCIGAHMSGLPLNPQLHALGGRLLRTARTRPEYTLSALGERPGLVRAERGTAIEGEVWVLPTCAIGALLEKVPAPLGFGTVALEDGPCLGFLAEASGVAGAHDISRFGGWRGWLAAGRPNSEA